MRETTRSLRTWFMTTGIAGLIAGTCFGQLGTGRDGLDVALHGTLFLGLVLLGIGHVIASIRLRDDLSSGAAWIQHMLLGSFVLLFAELVLAARAHPSVSTAGTLVIVGLGMALTTYLRANVRRLAHELAPRVAPSARAL